MDILKASQNGLNPKYLIQVSKRVDNLKIYGITHHRSLAQQFSETLKNQFNQLGQLLTLYSSDQIMKQSSIIRCKNHLQIFIIQKIIQLLSVQFPQISNLLAQSFRQLTASFISFQKLIHKDRLNSQKNIQNHKDKLIAALRRQAEVKRQHLNDLTIQLKDVQNQNFRLYHRMIGKAKYSADLNIKNSMNTSRKSILTGSPQKGLRKLAKKACIDQIQQILKSKWKKQKQGARRYSLNQYVSDYFKLKYGKDLTLAQQTRFRQAILSLSKQGQKRQIVIFNDVLHEQCQQGYFFEDKQLEEGLTKSIKKYLQRRGKSFYEIEKIIQGNQGILNEEQVDSLLQFVYPSNQASTFRMMIQQLTSSKKYPVTVKRIIEQIMMYQYRKHLIQIEDIIRQIKRIPNRSQYINYQDFQFIVARLIADRVKCQKIFSKIQNKQSLFLVSQIIEILHSVRKQKNQERQHIYEVV